MSREGLDRAAERRRGQTQIGQQPNHDVTGAGLLQGLHAVDQASRRLAGLEIIEDAPLEEVVAAAGKVVEGIRVSAQPLARAVHQVAITAAQYGAVALDHRAARRGDRVEYLVGAVAADRPVVAIGDALLGVDRRRGGTKVSRRNAETAAE
ncbi:hypothetical protein D9M68_795730 [compost metagenome]